MNSTCARMYGAKTKKKSTGNFRKTWKSSCSRPTSEITAFHTQCWRTSAILAISPTYQKRQIAALYTHSQLATATTNCQGIILKWNQNYLLVQQETSRCVLILKIVLFRPNTKKIAYNHQYTSTATRFGLFWTIFRPTFSRRRYNRSALYSMGSHTVYRMCVKTIIRKIINVF